MLRLSVIAILFSLAAPNVLAQAGQTRAVPASDADSDSEQVGYLLADKVYAKPDAFSDGVTAVSRDERVRIVPTSSSDGWYEVYKVGESKPLGYAYRPYVSRFGSGGPGAREPSATVPTSASTDRAVSTPAPAVQQSESLFEVTFADLPEDTGVHCTVEKWANVRRGPGLNHEAFGVIRPDVPFQILSIERGWGKIRLEGEEIGYVAGSLLHRVPTRVAAAPTQPLRGAITGSTVSGGGAAGGGTALPFEIEEQEAEVSQADALRNVLTGSGVDADAVVYVTRTGHKFHREGCKHLRSRTFAIPLAEAMLDYSPCRSCKPLNAADGE